MIELAVLVVIVLGFAHFCHTRLADARRRLVLDVGVERAHSVQYAESIGRLTEAFGYLLRVAFAPGEIDALKYLGLEPDAFEARLMERCAAVEGVVIGKREIDDTSVPVVYPTTLRTRHMYLLGETGSGKTTFLVNLADEDFATGNGFILVTPEIESVREIMGRVPRRRIGDVTVVDPTDDCTIPLNPFHIEPGEDIDLVTDETTEAFRQLFADTDAAPRTHAILRATVHALLHVPEATLLDASRILDRKDASFRRIVAAILPDEHARHFWEEVYPAYPRDAHLPIVTRFGRLIGPRVIRSMLCAPGQSFDFGAAMNEGRVVLCAFSDGLLGPATARLLGQLVITRVQLAAMRRAELSRAARRLSTLVIDEFAEFTAASASIETLLSRSRKYGLALIVSHQQTAQIPERTLKALLGNVGSIVSFRVGASDARSLARELTVNDDALSPTAFASLGVGEAICRIDRTTFRMRTILPPVRGDADVWVSVREHSRRRSPRPAGAPRPGRDPGHRPPKRPLDGLDPADPFGGGS